MNSQSISRIIKSDYVKLLPIMTLAFYIVFIPHLNYPYPVHVDEWRIWAWAEALLRAGSIDVNEPFFGWNSPDFFFRLESGFNLLWAVFHQISGIDWPTIFRYFPGVIFVITVLSVYALARREGFGWEAALFTCLILTTPGILGPAFLLPVALGLLFIPLSIFLAFNFRSIWSYLVVFIFMTFLVSMHAVTAIGVIIILIPFILFCIKGDFKHAAGIALALAIPFFATMSIVPFSWIEEMLLPTVQNMLTPQPPPWEVQLPMLIPMYGYLPIGLCLLGTLILAVKGGKKNYGLIAGLMALLLMLVAYFTFQRGNVSLYGRGLIFAMLLMGVIAGASLAWIRHLSPPDRILTRLKSAFWVRNAGNILCLIVIILVLATTIPIRQNIPYYNMIDGEDYQSFVWIRDNVTADHKTILDPWKATAFTAITGQYIYTRITMAPYQADMDAYAFLEQGCIDTQFLKKNGISMVYTRGECKNPDLTKVAEHVYLLK